MADGETLIFPRMGKGSSDPLKALQATVENLGAVADWLDHCARDTEHMSDVHIAEELEGGARKVRGLVGALAPICCEGQNRRDQAAQQERQRIREALKEQAAEYRREANESEDGGKLKMWAAADVVDCVTNIVLGDSDGAE